MVDQSKIEKIVRVFPFIGDADEDVRLQVDKHAVLAAIPAGSYIFIEGDECSQLALILSGRVRVYKPAESGREITLYRLEEGESCVLTASCIFSRNGFPAIAVTEEDVEAAIVPANVFRDWINRYEVWRNYVFDLLSRRLSSIISTLEEVAFRRMDIRIAEFLAKSYYSSSDVISMTHQDLAMELGTSREVVSRILKHFEYEGLITLKRGAIHISDIRGLSKKLEREKI